MDSNYTETKHEETVEENARIAPIFQHILMELDFMRYEDLFIKKGYDRNEALDYVQKNDLYSSNINTIHSDLIWEKVLKTKQEFESRKELNKKIELFLARNGPPKNLNIMILGVGGVGKSSLFRQYFKREFEQETTVTPQTVNYQISKVYGNNIIDMTVLDTPGQEHKFSQLPRYQFACLSGCFGVCSLDRPESLTQLENWYLSKIRQLNPQCPIVLLCNKVDLKSNFSNFRNQIERFRQNNGDKFKIFYTCAKTGLNVAQAVDELVFDMLKQLMEKEQAQNEKKNEEEAKRKKQEDSENISKCCQNIFMYIGIAFSVLMGIVLLTPGKPK